MDSLKKKNILICYQSAEFGGVEKHILDLIVGLSKKFNFYVVCPDGPLVSQYMAAGAVKHINLKPKFEADLFYVLKISKLIKKYQIDVVHSHELLTGCLATFGAFLGKANRRIYHVHTPFSMWTHKSIKTYPALIINTIVNFIVANFFATDVLALTESIKEVRLLKEFVFSDKIRIIPNGIDLSTMYFDEIGRQQIRNKYHIPQEMFVIGHMGRFSEEKRQAWIIKSAAEIAKNTTKDFRIVLAGGGKLLNQCKQLAIDLKIDSKIIFTDHFADNDKRAILSAYDGFILPSSAEGFGIVLIEAMAVGLNCLASDLAVLRDVGEDAISYFYVNQPESLTANMLNLIENPKIQNKNKVLEQVQKYDIKVFWLNYERLYEGTFSIAN